jgi:transposase
MLGLPPSVRIYFATELADMRKGIDGLRAIVGGALRQDPYAGHLFVFVGKAKGKVKILFWDRSGFGLYLKRLEKGRFQLPLERPQGDVHRHFAGGTVSSAKAYEHPASTAAIGRRNAEAP